MRIYLPATLSELTGPHLTARPCHAVTPALRAALEDEDEEGLEYAAQLLAADDSLDLLDGDTSPRRRVVVAADVAEELVVEVPEDEAHAPSLVRVTEDVPWSRVACAHVDEPAAEGDVRAALDGDDDAAERLADRDLLWFDVSELAGLAT